MSKEKEVIESIPHSILRRYNIIQKIGKGSYGVVWRVLDKETQEVYALKKVFGAFNNVTDSQRVYREISFLKQLNNPYIIKLISVHRAENDRDLFLVFECMESDVHAVIRAKILLDVHHRYIFWQLLCALKYIHSAGLIHRDLKPSNILINSDSSVKLCDFGLARAIRLEDIDDNNQIEMTDYVATRWYRPPEILFGSNYTFSVDMWAAGCILAELVSGKPLFPGNSTMDQLERIISYTGPPRKSDIDSMKSSFTHTMLSNLTYTKARISLKEKLNEAPLDAIDLVSKLIIFDPMKRLTAEQCLEHPYVAQFHNPEKELNAPKAMELDLSENLEHSIREYRNKIYKDVVTSTDIQGKRSRMSKNVQNASKSKKMTMNTKSLKKI